MDFFSQIHFGMLLDIFAFIFLSYMIFWQKSSIIEIQRGIQKNAKKGKRRGKNVEKRARVKSKDCHPPGMFCFGGVFILSKQKHAKLSKSDSHIPGQVSHG